MEVLLEPAEPRIEMKNDCNEIQNEDGASYYDTVDFYTVQSDGAG